MRPSAMTAPRQSRSVPMGLYVGMYGLISVLSVDEQPTWV